MAEQQSSAQAPVSKRWSDYDRLLTVLRSNRAASDIGVGWMSWRNKRCESISVNIQMNGHVISMWDRDGNRITMDELEFQYEAPPEQPKKGWRIRRWFGGIG